jgi:2-methylcitrate dehydratase PrpD
MGTAAQSEDANMTGRMIAFLQETALAAVPAVALVQAKLLILDTIGVALAATTHPIGAIIADHAGEVETRAEATIIGRSQRVTAPAAALANGTLANALDFDEGNHVVTHVLPAALAMAERQNASGHDLLAAFIVGFEVGVRMKDAIDGGRDEGRGPTRRGFWHVGLAGPIAATAAAARLLGLGHKDTAMALGISTCSAGGFRRNMGTMAKAFHSGHAARAAVEAVLLAERGFTADAQALEAPLGFTRAVTAPEQPDWKAITEKLGRPFNLAGKVKIKPYPACTPIQPVLEAVLALRREAGFAADDVALVEADLHTFSLFRLDPADADAVGFSGPYLIAAALVHGKVGLDEVAPENVGDPKIRALMKRIRHQPQNDDEKVTIRLADGRSLERPVLGVRRLITRAEVVAKYRDCAARALSARAVDELQDLVLALEDQNDLVRCAMLLAGQI